MSMNILMAIPEELLSIVLYLLDMPTIFSLTLTLKSVSEEHPLHKIFSSFLASKTITDIHRNTISKGYTNLFKWLVHNKEIELIEENWHYSTIAAENNQLDILKYLHVNKCKWHQLTCNDVASKGHLEILKYVYENGYYWDTIVSWIIG